MLMLVSGLDKQYYSPRVYVVAETDKMSAKRALTREQEWAAAAVVTVSSWTVCWCGACCDELRAAAVGAPDHQEWHWGMPQSKPPTAPAVTITVQQ